MATRSRYVTHLLGGGWATDLGTRPDVRVLDNNTMLVPFLDKAENLEYTIGGGFEKVGGTSKLNSSELESGADIMGLYDFWLQGTAGSPTQHRIVHVGTKIKKDDADASFSDLFTGLESGKVPSYSQIDDLLIIASDSTTDVPKEWDGATAQNLQGSPPNFAFSVEHEGRIWAAGDAANPSKVYYSGRYQPDNWSSAGSGEFNISPQDGDRITALAAHKGELIVFKGPYKGSIHRISGSSPTGGDAFAHHILVRGVGAVGHRMVTTFRDDLLFGWADGTIYQLQAVQQFGDFRRSSLSFPIRTWIHDNVKFDALKTAWMEDCPDIGAVVIGLPTGSSSVGNALLMLDYRFDPPRWVYQKAFGDMAVSGLCVVDPSDNDRRVFMTGGTDGFVRKMFRRDRSIDGGSAITLRMHTPFMDYGMQHLRKTLAGGSVSYITDSASQFVYAWQKPGGVSEQTQTITINQGTALGSFTLGTSKLSGEVDNDDFFDLESAGEARAFSLRIRQSQDAERLRVNNFGILFDIGDYGTD